MGPDYWFKSRHRSADSNSPAEKGYNVILHATRAENCDVTLEKINHFNTESLVVGAVLGDQKEEQKLIDTVLDKVGYIDILYNNAAVMSSWHDRMSEIPMKEWMRSTRSISFLWSVSVTHFTRSWLNGTGDG